MLFAGRSQEVLAITRKTFKDHPKEARLHNSYSSNAKLSIIPHNLQ